MAEFVSGIDLRAMDANQRLAGDQAFTFSGTSARANAVWFTAVEGGILVRGDVTGDQTQDFEIMLSGVAHIRAEDLMLRRRARPGRGLTLDPDGRVVSVQQGSCPCPPPTRTSSPLSPASGAGGP